MYADSNPLKVKTMKKMDLYRSRQRNRIWKSSTKIGRHENPCSQVGSWNRPVTLPMEGPFSVVHSFLFPKSNWVLEFNPEIGHVTGL